MRQRLAWIPILIWLAAGCTSLPLSLVAPAPTSTPVSLKPANLLTPRPIPPGAVAQATPAALDDATVPSEVAEHPAVQPAPTPVTTNDTLLAVRGPGEPQPQSLARDRTLTGAPVAASEPLVGLLLDDRLTSPIIGASFAYRVYLPPDYLTSPTRRYPVLYMLHGAGGNYTEWSDSFLPEQIDRLIAADQIQSLIVVMPDDGEATYFANWDNGPRWGDYLTEDVVSTIDQRYRTLTSPEDRAIGGLSMGGLGALNLALQHPDVFGVAGSHSPSVRLEPDPNLWFLTGDNFWKHNPIWLAEHATGVGNLKIWLDVGADDYWLPNIQPVHTALVESGLQVEWHEFPGEHDAEYWVEHVPDYLRFYSRALALPNEVR
jgi:putative tributyrin esterase